MAGMRRLWGVLGVREQGVTFPPPYFMFRARFSPYVGRWDVDGTGARISDISVVAVGVIQEDIDKFAWMTRTCDNQR